MKDSISLGADKWTFLLLGSLVGHWCVRVFLLSHHEPVKCFWAELTGSISHRMFRGNKATNGLEHGFHSGVWSCASVGG